MRFRRSRSSGPRQGSASAANWAVRTEGPARAAGAESGLAVQLALPGLCSRP